jgi:hypothetical protein
MPEEIKMTAMCEGCAYREGTYASERGRTTADLCTIAGVPFLCHANMEPYTNLEGRLDYRSILGQPELICFGWIEASHRESLTYPKWLRDATLDILHRAVINDPDKYGPAVVLPKHQNVW